MSQLFRLSLPPAALNGRILMRAFILAAFFLLIPPAPCLAATPLAKLEQDLAKERKKAVERRQSLKSMTEEERKLNANLAAAEKRILDLEKGIASQQDKILEIGSADESARNEYEAILAEVGKTEEALGETLRLLWEVGGRRMLMGGADMAAWAQVDREYVWSKDLYAALESYRKKLDDQEMKLTRVMGRREKLSKDMQKRLSDVNNEKSRLLKSRIAYDRELAELRKKRSGTEAELEDILQLVDSLNFEIAQRASEDISRLKGRLPLPVKGRVQQRYAPGAAPASRGIGFSAPEQAVVTAVAGGKVVHNDILRGFGTVLIVQHGEDYYSLYAFLGNSPLKVGDDVAGRQKIGTVGYYPAIKGPGLYFELRFKQKAINPEQWFAS